MAKKHSSKTATQEALQAANPRLQVFNKWAGVNFKDAPLGWEPGETKFYAHHQTDLPLNNWLIQNNMVVDMSDSVSTRDDAEIIARAPNWGMFTGVACLYQHYLLMVVKTKNTETNYEYIYWYDITKRNPTYHWMPTKIDVLDNDPNYAGTAYELRPEKITEIGFYENTFIALCEYSKSQQEQYHLNKHITLTCEIPDVFDDDETYEFVSAPKLYEPLRPLRALVYGMDWIAGENYNKPAPEDIGPDSPYNTVTVRFTFVYTLTNKWGSTLKSPPVTVWVEEDPYGFTPSKYIMLQNRQPIGTSSSTRPGGGFWVKDEDGNEFEVKPGEFTGIDIWVNQDENQNYVLIAHIEVTDDLYDQDDPEDEIFNYNWFGTEANTDMYTNALLAMPQENTTYGPEARYFTSIDSRLYWWGNTEKPYKLLIGGNVGNELNLSRSVGGGWIDIEPGSGYSIEGVCKWKTASGANIVTILTGNVNTNSVKRFNLVELLGDFTNEIKAKGWQYEEVSNVVGCNSRWGYGVFGDGLYSVSRYGLMLTTMTAEYNNQMKNQKVSEVIDPVFTERLGNRLRDARLVHIDGIVYLILSESTAEDEPTNLDKVILCYDLGKKAWYTFTPGDDGDDSSVFLHALAIDSEDRTEGLGIVTSEAVTLYPTTGIQKVAVPKFDILLESGELCSRVPMQSPYYVEHLEFRFDYFIGNCDLIIEGVDYYGRKFEILKHLGTEPGPSPDPGLEKRDYVEWVRVQKLVEFFRIRIKGPCRCRLTHIINKAYLYNNLIGMPYGFDAQDTFINRHGKEESIHHYIDDYNNLRRAIVT